jgi:hypothetical protein
MALIPEIWINTRGEFGIDNLDQLMAAFPKFASRAVNSALASEGHRLIGVMKKAIDAGGPAGARWPEKHPFADILKRARKSWVKRPRAWNPAAKAAGKPLLKFKGGIRYQVDKEMSLASIGFVNPRAGFERLIALASEGFDTPVTDRMRRLFFGVGQPLAASVIKSPARPLIGPVFAAEKGNIAANLERKFFEKLNQYMKDEK